MGEQCDTSDTSTCCVSLGRSLCTEENIVITLSKIMQRIALFMALKSDKDS